MRDSQDIAVVIEQTPPRTYYPVYDNVSSEALSSALAGTFRG